jgi:hypothetical protein
MKINSFLRFLLAGFLVLGSSIALSQSINGTELQYRLEHKENFEKHFPAVDMVAQILFKGEGTNHCKPKEATVGQAVAITLKFLNQNPELWHYSAQDLTAAALAIAWPCPKKR